jgi:hypothetical protein
MPRRDGTGPSWGSGPGTGRGAGQGGSRMGRKGGSRAGAGPAGECACPKCGAVSPHEVGIPCSFKTCPKCGAKMVRK